MTDSFTFVHPLENWDELWGAFKQVIKHKNRFFPIDETNHFFEYADLVIAANH